MSTLPESPSRLPRRGFLRAGAAGAAGLMLAGGTAAAAAVVPGPRPEPAAEPLPAGWRAWRKIDAHNHLFSLVHRPGVGWDEVDRLLAAADLLGITRLCCSRPVVAGVLADAETVRDSNDAILAAMRRHPDRISGYAFVQPGLGRAALDEIDRCLDAGMIGVKLYNQFNYADPVLHPVAERCVARGVPFLGHSGHVTDPRVRALQPRISDAADFGVLARRYPELMLILGHLTGGGDWEWTLRELRECPGVFLDTSGSVLEDDSVGRAVRELGVERVLFATDAVMEGGVGKVLGAALTPAERSAVFHGNLERLLARRKA